MSAKLLESEFYVVLVEGQKGDIYSPETTIKDMTKPDGVLRRLLECLGKYENATVLHFAPNQHTTEPTFKRTDASQHFAELLAKSLIEQGLDIDSLVGWAFISAHLTNKQLYELGAKDDA